MILDQEGDKLKRLSLESLYIKSGKTEIINRNEGNLSGEWEEVLRSTLVMTNERNLGKGFLKDSGLKEEGKWPE